MMKSRLMLSKLNTCFPSMSSAIPKPASLPLLPLGKDVAGADENQNHIKKL